MKRILTAAVTLAVAVAAARADGPRKVTIRWHGQSFFEIISSKGTRVVTDPHAIDAYGRVAVRADLILISHLHNDHTHVEVVENKARILWGLKVTGRKVDWNAVDEQFRDVHVRSVGVYHDTAQGMERGKNTVFVIEMDGLRIVHLGDLGHVLTDQQVRAIGPVDVLLIPVGGVYTINGSEAKHVVEQLSPRQYIIPMHYGTKVYDELLPIDEFLEDQDRADVQRFDGTNTLVVSTDFKPRRPVVAILGWK